MFQKCPKLKRTRCGCKTRCFLLIPWNSTGHQGHAQFYSIAFIGDTALVTEDIATKQTTTLVSLQFAIMGNTNVNARRRPPRDRRRELTIVFYFIGGFVLIRIWIFLVESHNVLVEAVGAGVTFLLLVALLWRYKILRDREEEEEREMDLHPEVNDADLVLLRSLFHNQQNGLSQEVIDSLECFKYSARSKEDNGVLISGIVVECPPDVSSLDPVIVSTRADIENQNNHRNVPETCCSVCLADYVEGEELMMLPCQHAYHKVCVSQWLQRQPQCPLCKQDVIYLLDQTGRLREIAAFSGVTLEPSENNNNLAQHLNGPSTHGNSDTNGGTSDPTTNYVTSASPDTL